MEKLSLKHRRFVDAYIGDSAEAAKIAGYVGVPEYLKQVGDKLLQYPLVKQAINDRAKYIKDTKAIVADRLERQALWTAIMRNQDPHRVEEKDQYGVPVPEGNIPIPVRLKATELLGKSEGDFVDKLNVSGTMTITDIIERSYNKAIDETDDIEAIEAAYTELRASTGTPPSLPLHASTADTVAQFDDIEEFI